MFYRLGEIWLILTISLIYIYPLLLSFFSEKILSIYRFRLNQQIKRIEKSRGYLLFWGWYSILKIMCLIFVIILFLEKVISFLV